MRPLARVLIDESHRQAWSTRPEVAAVMNPVNPADASYAVAAGAAERAGLEVTVHVEGALDDDRPGGDRRPRPAARRRRCLGAHDRRRLTAADRRRARRDRPLRARRWRPRHPGRDRAGQVRQQLRRPRRPLRHRHRQHDGAGPVPCVQGRADLGSRRPRARTEARPDRPGRRRPASTARARCTASPPATSSRSRPWHARAAAPIRRPPGWSCRRPSLRAGSSSTSDSDLFGDDSITDLDHRQLWLNLVTWAAGSRAALVAAGLRASRPGSPTTPRGPTSSTPSSRSGRCRPRTDRST